MPHSTPPPPIPFISFPPLFFSILYFFWPPPFSFPFHSSSYSSFLLFAFFLSTPPFFSLPFLLSFPFPFPLCHLLFSSPLLRSGSLPYVTNWKQEPSSGPAQMWPSMAPSQTYTSYMTSKSGSIKLHPAHVYSLQGAQYSGHIDAFRNNMVTSWCTGALHSRTECRRCLNGWVYLREKGITCSSLLSQTCDVESPSTDTEHSTQLSSLSFQTWLLHFVSGRTWLIRTSLWASEQRGQPFTKLIINPAIIRWLLNTENV